MKTLPEPVRLWSPINHQTEILPRIKPKPKSRVFMKPQSKSVTILRYATRKMWVVAEKGSHSGSYITLPYIEDLISHGVGFKIVEHHTGIDLTTKVLAQVYWKLLNEKFLKKAKRKDLEREIEGLMRG